LDWCDHRRSLDHAVLEVVIADDRVGGCEIHDPDDLVEVLPTSSPPLGGLTGMALQLLKHLVGDVLRVEFAEWSRGVFLLR
jgi:hypothetical protein